MAKESATLLFNWVVLTGRVAANEFREVCIRPARSVDLVA